MMRVKISPKYKKSVTELEYCQHKQGDKQITAVVDTVWRWGTFYADLSDEEYNNLVEESKKDSFDMYTEVSSYFDFEMEECWDGISCDVTFHSIDDELVDYYENKYENEGEDCYYSSWLEENEFDWNDCEYYISGPLELEIVDD